jgi:hypothetical protein
MIEGHSNELAHHTNQTQGFGGTIPKEMQGELEIPHKQQTVIVHQVVQNFCWTGWQKAMVKADHS